MKRAVLIDVSAVMYRSFYSLMNMTNSKKEPTGAVYGFTNVLLGIIEEFTPDFICACFDVRRETLKRRELLSSYKEHRESMPEAMIPQIKRIEDILDGFGIKRVKIDGYEADDVIGTVSRLFDEKEIETFIVTGDKDLSQVISKNVKIALLGKGEGKERFKIIAEDKDVIEQLGVLPSEIPDLFGLQGDSSDGIPGVKGVGPKTAIKLIDEYKTLENLYLNIDKISGKLKEKLIEEKETAFISRELAKIERNIEKEIKIEELEKEEINENRLFEIFSELEFKSLIKKMELKKIESENDNNKNSSGVIVDDKKLTEEVFEFFEGIEEEKSEIEIISKETDLKNIKGDFISVFYSEAGLAIFNGKERYYVPINHRYLGAENNEFNSLKKFIKTKKIAVYDLKKFLRAGFEIEKTEKCFDLMIAFYLLNPDGRYSIEKTAEIKLREEMADYKTVFGKKDYFEIDIKEMAGYSLKRAEVVFRLKEEIETEMKNRELTELYRNIEMKLIPVLTYMEKNGIKIDVNYFEKYGKELEEKIVILEKNIYEEAGETFNINSPKQLSEILFDKMGIFPLKKTKTGYSTDNEVLEELAFQKVKIAGMILEYRQYVKLKTTYVEGLLKAVEQDGKVHTSFNQDGTATGRLSSSNPNLQNIPVKTDEGIKIRMGFTADKGKSILSIDYSQIELRVLAEVTGDENLVKAYKDDIDLHNLTALKIFGKNDFEEVTREERIIAKIVNFSIIYGKTAFGLSKEIGISNRDAKEYIDKYFEQYKGVKIFIENTIKEAEEKGYVQTLFGRKRVIEGIESKNKTIKNHAERMAVNTIIQGTAADILKMVMIKIYDEIKECNDIKMNLQVHDELVFEVDDEKVEFYKEKLTEIMENFIKFEKVKLKVNASVAKNWGLTK